MSEDVPQPDRAIDWWWTGSGLLLVLAPGAALATEWGAIRASHPAYTILLLVTAGGGGLLIWRGFRRKPRGGTLGRVLVRGVIVLLAIVLGGLAWVLRPLPATDLALRALGSGPDVESTQSSTRIEMRPVADANPTSLIFYPGGLVDPRAYANILRPIAAAGYAVTIVKPPFGFAILAQGAAADLAAPGDVVAGHSLGGVAAAIAAGDSDVFGGLVLWGAYPASSIADRSQLAVTSIYGSEDILTTPEEIAASRTDLPPSTVFVEVTGAVHSQFGDYGGQPGGGSPTITAERAQEQIVAATLALLDEVSGRASP